MAFYTTQLLIDDNINASSTNPGWSFSNGWVYQDLKGYSFPNTTNSSNQSVEIIFSGIHIVIFGGGPASYDWSLDGSPSATTNASGTYLDSTNEIMFNSTLLSDSNHTLTFGNFTGNITIGYALIAPGPNTPVNVDPVVLEIDDTDPAITYSGNWFQTTNPSRHDSNTPGSMVEFGFCGSYTSFSGTFDPDLTGNVTLGISVDNETQIQTVYSSNEIPKSLFYPFWDTHLINDPSNCQHLVRIELISITGGQTFSFGSFYYQPSFTLFGEAPVITVVPPPSSSTAISTGSPSGILSSHASNATSSSSHTRSSSHSIVGPIAGTVGGLVAIGILLVILFLRKRQRDNVIEASTRMEQPSPFFAIAPIDSQGIHRKQVASELSVDAPGGSPFYSNKNGRTSAFHVPPDQLPAGPSDLRSRPQSISEPAVPSSSSTGGGQPDNDNVSRQMMEIIQSLQQRVDDLQRPPAYEEES